MNEACGMNNTLSDVRNNALGDKLIWITHGMKTHVISNTCSDGSEKSTLGEQHMERW